MIAAGEHFICNQRPNLAEDSGTGTTLGPGAAGSIPDNLPGNVPDDHGGAASSTSGVTFVAIPSAIALVIVTPFIEALLVAVVGPLTGSGACNAAGNDAGDDACTSRIATILALVLPQVTWASCPHMWPTGTSAPSGRFTRTVEA
jgi:hypothetical protein